MRTRNSIRGFVHPSVGVLVRQSYVEHELKIAKTRISAPAHQSGTCIGPVSGLVLITIYCILPVSLPARNKKSQMKLLFFA